MSIGNGDYWWLVNNSNTVPKQIKPWDVVYTPAYPYKPDNIYDLRTYPMEANPMPQRPRIGEHLYPGIPLEIIRPVRVDTVVRVENVGGWDIDICTSKRFGYAPGRLTLHAGDATTRLIVPGEGLWAMSSDGYPGLFLSDIIPDGNPHRYKRFPGAAPKPPPLPETGRTKRKPMEGI